MVCRRTGVFGAWMCPVEEDLKDVATVSTDPAATSGGSRAAEGGNALETPQGDTT
jgi:hypothetical protein